jgi:mRNA interferase RelE/StbE
LVWTIEYSDKALRQTRKLEKHTAKRIIENMEKLAELKDVRSLGHALTGQLGTLWRYRVGDFRIICDIQDMIVRILVVEVGHQSDI